MFSSTYRCFCIGFGYASLDLDVRTLVCGYFGWRDFALGCFPVFDLVRLLNNLVFAMLFWLLYVAFVIRI